MVSPVSTIHKRIELFYHYQHQRKIRQTLLSQLLLKQYCLPLFTRSYWATDRTILPRSLLFSSLVICFAHSRLLSLIPLLFDVNIFFLPCTVHKLYRCPGSRFQSDMLWPAPTLISFCLIFTPGQSSIFPIFTFSSQFHGLYLCVRYSPTSLDPWCSYLLVQGHVSNSDHEVTVVLINIRDFWEPTLEIRTRNQSETCNMALFQHPQLGAKKDRRRVESCYHST